MAVRPLGGRRQRMRRLKWLAILLIGLVVSTVNAQQLSFVLDTTENRSAEIQAIAAQLQEIGVDAQVRIWQSAVLRDEMVAGNRFASTADWGSAYFDPYGLAIPKLKTNDRGNRSFYSNAVVDEAFETASTTIDADVRREAYFTAQHQIFADAPWVFAYVLQNIEA